MHLTFIPLRSTKNRRHNISFQPTIPFVMHCASAQAASRAFAAEADVTFPSTLVHTLRDFASLLKSSAMVKPARYSARSYPASLRPLSMPRAANNGANPSRNSRKSSAVNAWGPSQRACSGSG